MKRIKFTEEKPAKGGKYWYYGNRSSDTPRIAEWNDVRQQFEGDTDQIGPHALIDPVYWAHIEYPDNTEQTSVAADCQTERDVTPLDSCFDCVNFHLCYMRRGVEEQIREGINLLNIDGDVRPGRYADIYRALGSSCMEFSRAGAERTGGEHNDHPLPRSLATPRRDSQGA